MDPDQYLQEIKVSRYAKAYIKDKSLIDNVRFHKNREGVLTLDILDFFGSIKMKDVQAIFVNMGYSSIISNLLAKLCTYDDALPQGAPTSPYLSNIYLTKFDEIVSKYCNDNEIRYTRYADDLTFSGEVEKLEIVDYIKAQLKDLHLTLNDDKSKLMRPHERQLVTGIVVNKILQIPKSDRNFIRNEVHYLTKFGLADHLRITKNTKANYIIHLLGKINFALHINPKDEKMKQYKVQVAALLAQE